MRNKKVVIEIKDLKNFYKSLEIIKPFLKLNPHNSDLSKIFKVPPTKEQFQNLYMSSSGFPFGMLGALLTMGDIWAHEFGTELTPEMKKFLKKIK